VAIFEQLANCKDTERKIILEVEAKRALAIEKLFFSLVLMTAQHDSENLAQISE